MKLTNQTLQTSNLNNISQTSNYFNSKVSNKGIEKINNTFQQLRINNDQIIRNKSFEIPKQIDTNTLKARRKSDYEQLSQKQIRLDCMFPTTCISYLEQLQQIQKVEQITKNRRKTLLQKMSSLLIKHQTVLKNFSNNGAKQQKQNEAPQEIEQIVQQQSQNNDLEIYDKIQQKNYQFRTHRYTKKKVSTPVQKSKVVLDVTRQSNKPFKAIANYMNNKSASFRDLSESQSPKVIIKLKQQNYISKSNLFEFQDLVFSPKSSVNNRSNLIRSCINLPDVKTTSFINNIERLPQIYKQSQYRKKY